VNSEKFAAARHFFRISSHNHDHSSQTPAEYPRYLDVRATHCNFAASNNLNKKIVINKKIRKMMKKYFGMTLIAMFVCGSLVSCDKDDSDDILDANEGEEVEYYDYSEKGFFMNGDIKIHGCFDNDSVMEGYAKYVKRTAHYRTTDGKEGEYLFGYGLVVNIDNVARIYSDDVTYNADSTMISCNGQIELAAYDNKPHDAYITAGIDSIGKPHLITCKAAIGSKKIILQFRQTYTISEYDSIEELPKEDEFSI
jgi:hypothetical protein